MNILSIETSTDWCGIALIVNGKCLKKIQEKTPRGHSENLPTYYNKLINDSKLFQFLLDQAHLLDYELGLGLPRDSPFQKVSLSYLSPLSK